MPVLNSVAPPTAPTADGSAYTPAQVRDAYGITTFKIKVGRETDANVRRCAVVRDEIGRQRQLLALLQQAIAA